MRNQPKKKPGKVPVKALVRGKKQKVPQVVLGKKQNVPQKATKKAKQHKKAKKAKVIKAKAVKKEIKVEKKQQILDSSNGSAQATDRGEQQQTTSISTLDIIDVSNNKREFDDDATSLPPCPSLPASSSSSSSSAAAPPPPPYPIRKEGSGAETTARTVPAAVSNRFSHQQQRNYSRKQQRHNTTEIRSFTDVENFYCVVLDEMGPFDPLQTSVLDEVPVPTTKKKDLPFPSSFANAKEYFDAMKEVAMDETSASIANSLEENPDTRGSIELNFVTASLDCQSLERGLVVVEMSSIGGNGSVARAAAAVVDELNRPGNVFLIYPSKATTRMKTNTTTTLGSGNNKPQVHDPLQCLAVVAQGARASLIYKTNKTNKAGGMAKIPGQNSSSSSKLPLWISSQCLLAQTLLSQAKADANATATANSTSKYTFTAVCLGSILQYQRMVAACVLYPNPPFLSSFLGLGPGMD